MPATEPNTTEPTDVAGDDDDEVLGPWPAVSLWKVVVLCAAFCFLGGAAVYYLSNTGHPSAGSVDVGFLQDMITHHEQAHSSRCSSCQTATIPSRRASPARS